MHDSTPAPRATFSPPDFDALRAYLLYDRGTRFGLEAGRRAESVLASLPPLAAWPDDWRPEPGSAEERLGEFLVPRDWLRQEDHGT